MSSFVYQIAQVEAITGYVFRNKMLCVEALQMQAPEVPVHHEGVHHRIQKNKSLALVGDRLLEFILSAAWYQAKDAQSNSPNRP